MEWIIAGGVGLVLGGIIGWLAASRRNTNTVSRERFSALEKDKTRLEESVSRLEMTVTEQKREIGEKSLLLSQLEIAKAEAETRLEAERRNIAEQKALLGEAETKLKDTFSALASKVLTDNSKSFLVSAEEKLKGTTRPLTEKLEEYRQLAQKIIGDYGGVDNQLKSLDKQTRLLVDALKRPQVRGRWGETTLRRLVELAGMASYCDFDEQKKSDEGKLRPDMVVRLPNERVIIIDAKTPGDHYLRALEADSDEERARSMEEFGRTVQDRLKELSQKNYTSEFKHTPEFVVQFIPNEAFFVAALEAKPELIDYGWERGVMLASPTTLISLLLAVAQGWKEEKLKDTVELIAQEGEELYKRICTMGAHIVDLGKNLNGAVTSYDKFVGSIEGRLLPTARRLKELSAATGQPLPELTPLSRSSRVVTAAELLPGSADEQVNAGDGQDGGE